MAHSPLRQLLFLYVFCSRIHPYTRVHYSCRLFCRNSSRKIPRQKKEGAVGGQYRFKCRGTGPVQILQFFQCKPGCFIGFFRGTQPIALPGYPAPHRAFVPYLPGDELHYRGVSRPPTCRATFRYLCTIRDVLPAIGSRPDRETPKPAAPISRRTLFPLCPCG